MTGVAPVQSRPMGKSILIAEDEAVLRSSLAELLTEEGYEVLQAADGKAAHAMVLQRPVDLVLSDIRMPEMDGLVLLDALQKVVPQTPVIMMTAFGTVESAVAAMRAGAYDYLLKPVNFDDLLTKVSRALQFSEMARAQRVITEQLAEGSTFHNLVGHSAPMARLFETVRKLSTVKSN